ncbi:helicase-associated domain-containing protein [Spirilliplanes yamanashiensis]|uniref:Helicase XPB/Ssl2 N-terminal domain-containing protein n=1 Tax=Spirilliplanes yamanashiensis TaxID=42233 RepID=A0A8J3Y9N9_9ACTN|nr:helicase-associated domain-containing protein [Spirilliplanes yamanashiensis]MDP9815521.1 hypothetical protein [Spirilliplanes yamanashiensis]GIJ03775.1 hypothetical protein Sya03_31270 [Spirilliplanes yamanashiensis]
MATNLADQLRALPDEALGALLRLRPDLVVPVPSDLGALAARAQSRGSVARCLDSLDQFTLEILDAVRLSWDGERASEAAALALAGDTAAARAALDRLKARFLVYGAGGDLHVAGAVGEVTSPYPAGLGRPAEQLDARAAALAADPAKLRRTVLAAAAPARAVLDRLAAGPPLGAQTSAAMAEPVQWLVDNALLVRVAEGSRAPHPDGDLIELPREVGLLLRRDSGPLGELHPDPPAPETATRTQKAVDNAGAGQAMEAVRHTEALLDALTAEPATVLRSGGLGVRDLRRLARAVGLDDGPAALLLEVAAACGLLGETDAQPTARGVQASRALGAAEQVFLPTTGFDLWRAAGTARRWELLAQAWLAMTRQPGLVGQRDERDRPFNALAPELERAAAPQSRRELLGALGGLPKGAAPDTGGLLALLTWRAPRRARGREAAYRDTVTEAAVLGVTALGALTSYGRVLVAEADPDGDRDPLGIGPDGNRSPGGPSPAVAALDRLLPAPVDHVLVQADLSVVVPGPPEPELANELAAVAEQESAGGASVFRVTAAGVRRALDAGYSAGDLHTLFKRRSRTPVPQALTYLIDDVARRHGGLRVGGAGSYLRSDDEALVAQVFADARLGPLGLRRLAPTVLCTAYPSQRLLEALRDAGYAPVPEDAGGAVVLSRPKARRAPARMPALARLADPLTPTGLSGPRLAGVVEQIRKGDAAARTARRAPTTVRAASGGAVAGLTSVQAHSQALAVLQQAVRDKAQVWVGYVDAHGATLSRLVRPVSLGAGYLRAEDDRTETLHTFALHRITAAVLEE